MKRSGPSRQDVQDQPELEDGLQCPSVDVGVFTTSTACFDLDPSTFDLSNLNSSSAGSNGYFMLVSSRWLE